MPGVAGFKASLFGLSHHLESLIDHAGNRAALMARAHEALDDSMSQAKLAYDRTFGFMADRSRGPGMARSVSRWLRGALRLR